MAEQTAYFNLITRLSTITDSGTTKQLSGFLGLQKQVSDQSYILGKALTTALGFATYQVVSSTFMGLINFAQESIDAFIDFEYAMAGVSRTVSDFSRHEVLLSNFARTISMELGVSVLETAKAMEYMGSVGYTATQIMADFNDIAMMSVALQIDLEDAINTVVKAQQIWSSAQYKAIEVSDALNQMTNKTALNMDFLSGALRMGGPAAAATNTSLEAMLAILVPLAAAGFKGTMAGRSLNTTLVQMGLKAGELTEHLNQLKEKGFDVNIEAMEGFATRSTIDQIVILSEVTKNLTRTEQIRFAQLVAGTHFLKQFLIQMDAAPELYADLETATDSAGSTQEEFAKMMTTTEKEMQRLEARAKDAQINMGDVWAPIIKGLTEAYVDLAVAIGNALNPLAKVAAENRSWNEIGEKWIKLLELGRVAVDRGAMSEKELYALKKTGVDATDDLTKALEAVAKAQEIVNALFADRSYEASLRGMEYIIAANREAARSVKELKDAETELIIAQFKIEEAMEVAGAAVDELNRVFSYLSGEITKAQFETRKLTLHNETARAAYNDLSSELDNATDAMNRTSFALAGLSDQMYDNRLESAELRLDQMRLDRQYEEGYISERKYRDESAKLERQQRDLRIEGQKLSIDQMILNKQFEEESKTVDTLKGKVTLLVDADNKLQDTKKTLLDVGGDWAKVLERIIKWTGLAESAADDYADSVGDLEAETGTSLSNMLSNFSQYATELNKLGFLSYADILEYEKTGELPGARVVDPTPTAYEWKYSGFATDSSGVTQTVIGSWEDSKSAALAAWKVVKEAKGYVSPASYSPTRREAALGFEGWVNQPTMFMAGEGGRPEYVNVTPQGGDMEGGGRGGIGNVTINLPNVTSVEDPAQVKRIFRRVMLELSGER